MSKNKNSQSFLRIPFQFFSDPYRSLPAEAKLMYSLLLNRESLSKKNGWTDENGRFYVYYTIEDMAHNLCCSKPKVVKLYKLLSEKGLITKTTSVRGTPSKIVIHRVSEFNTSELNILNPPSYEFLPDRVSEFNTNKTDMNKTEMNNSISFSVYEEVEEKIREQISYEVICSSHGKEYVDSVVSLLCDTLCCNSAEIKICGTEYPMSVVRKRLLSLNEDHIAYAYEVLADAKEEIVNIRQYLLSVLFNAPSTMNSYFDMRVKREFYDTKMNKL